MIVRSDFRPAWWLRNPHAQTMWPVLTRRTEPIALTRERVELPDGDFIDVEFAPARAGPVVLLLHGLEGDPASVYAAAMLNALTAAGYQAVRMYHRSCSGELNRRAQLYHSGFTDDVVFLLARLRKRFGRRPLGVIGYSLGGSVVLNLLGRPGVLEDAALAPDCAVAVSVPFELGPCAERINRGISRIYQRRLLESMQHKLRRKLEQPGMRAEFGALDTGRALGARDFWTFDDAFTAPLHGFRGAEHYYTVCSARQYLREIEVPTLLLHAADDPFMTPAVVPDASELATSVTLELSARGGHVGFVAGVGPGRADYWLEPRIITGLAGLLG